ncbi:MAG: DUF2891 domain-containing protein [Candidatus Krumholzibacteria bacterium]|nr:DUF2891 domain-containing protein [Candidatus Krumholzibacteria bacterium]
MKRFSIIHACFMIPALVLCSEPRCETGVESTLVADGCAGVELTLDAANRLAALPLKCMQREFPNKPGETLAAPDDIGSPRSLHPAFYGCFDWHSSVHGHWMLVKLLNTFPDLKDRDLIRGRISENLSAANILGEVAYFQRIEEKSFERTYGWAWLLKLAEEIHTFDDPLARELEGNLLPLAELIVRRYMEFLPKLLYPIRVGEHANTAFGLCFAWDYAVALGNTELKALVEKRARDYFLADRDCPLSWEPGGYDFLSPCLEEADIMRRILPREEFAEWLGNFLPSLADSGFALAPGEVLDRADGKLVHLDGLNFSRAWCLYGIASRLEEYGHLKAVADLHMRRSLDAIAAGTYEGEHWLASFAIHALSASRDRAKAID